MMLLGAILVRQNPVMAKNYIQVINPTTKLQRGSESISLVSLNSLRTTQGRAELVTPTRG